MDGLLPYHLYMPQGWSRPLVVSAPHSGREIPGQEHNPAIRAAIEELDEALSDTRVHQLALPAAASLGFPVLSSRYSRVYIDLNREITDLDPAVVEGASLAGKDQKTRHRLAAGLGLIPRLPGSVPARKLSLLAVQSRIDRAYLPYHNRLQSLIGACLQRFGACLLIDLHSMPPVPPAMARRILAQSALPPLPMAAKAYGTSPLNLVLGDCFGRSLPASLARHIQQFFHAQGLTIAHNQPYAGGHITATFADTVPTFQLEICRSLYHGSAESLHAKALEQLFADFCQTLPANLPLTHQQAAE